MDTEKREKGRPAEIPAVFEEQKKKMRQLSDFLKAQGRIKTQPELAPFFGLTSSRQVSRIYLGHAQITDRHKQSVAWTLKIRPEWWDKKDAPIEDSIAREPIATPKQDTQATVGLYGLPNPSSQLEYKPNPEDYYQIPFTKDRISAGPGTSLQVFRTEAEEFDSIPRPLMRRGEEDAYFSIQVDGDSMEPLLSRGQRIAVNTTWREWRHVRGKMIAIQHGTDKAQVKIAGASQKPDHIMLIPANVRKHSPEDVKVSLEDGDGNFVQVAVVELRMVAEGVWERCEKLTYQFEVEDSTASVEAAKTTIATLEAQQRELVEQVSQLLDQERVLLDQQHTEVQKLFGKLGQLREKKGGIIGSVVPHASTGHTKPAKKQPKGKAAA